MSGRPETKTDLSRRALGLVLVLRIPIEDREELDDSPLLVASHVLAQRASDRRGLRALTADLDSLFIRIGQSALGGSLGL